MKNFILFFRFELKRFLCVGNLIILLLALYLVYNGVNGSQKMKTKVQEFKELESIIFSKILNYLHYSFQGFRVLYVPGEAAIFFGGAGIILSLTAAVDSVTKLGIKNDCKSGFIFREYNFIPPGFAGLMMLLFSILALFNGYETFRDKEYLKFLSGFLSYKKIYFQLALVRFILLVLSFVLIFALMFACLFFRDVTLPAQDVQILFIYLAVTILLLLLFFLTGTITGSIRPKAAAVTATIALWLIALWFIPGVLSKIINRRAEKIISSYKIELEKFQIMNDFEKRAVEENDEFNQKNIKGAQKVIEKFYNLDYKKMEAAEEKLKKDISEVINYYRRLSIFFPTTFYHALCREASSMGFDNFIDFYSSLQENKRKFVRFWIDRVYYNDPKVLVNFVKENENLYFARSRLPGNFAAGLLVLLFYIAVLTGVSFWCYKRTFFKIAAPKKARPREADIKLKTGQFKVWITRRETFKNLLYSLFSGENKRYRKKGHSRKIFIDDVDISAAKSPGKPIYLCHTRHIPARIKVADLVSFVCGICGKGKKAAGEFYKDPEIALVKNEKFSEIKKRLQGEILLKFLDLKKSKIYLSNEVTIGMPIDFYISFKEKMEALKKAGALVIYFVSTEVVVDEAEYEENEYHDSSTWVNLVGEHKKLKKRTPGAAATPTPIPLLRSSS